MLQVDGGANQTFASLDAGQSITLNAATGTITATLAAGLTTGTVTGSQVSTGDGSLATVVGNINSAGAGVTATAVQVGLNTYRLQLTSNTAGANNGENIDAAAFNGNVGGFLTLTAAADAQVTVGDGAGSYVVTSSTNSLTGLLPGVTVDAEAGEHDPGDRHGQPRRPDHRRQRAEARRRGQRGADDRRGVDEVRPDRESGWTAHRRPDRDPAHVGAHDRR